MLVTLKVRAEVWNLRSRRAFTRILRGLEAARERNGTRIVQFSVQPDHVHLIVETAGRGALARGVQGLCVRLARALNRMMQRRGAVFADRYHDRVLRTPRQVRHAIAYVLCNARKHGIAPRVARWLDPCSSAASFDGWHGLARPAAGSPVAAPRSWLLRVGWRRLGLLDPDHVPGSAPV